MRDFPIFTTEYGVSSLVLKEIPYKKTAYIRIQDVQPGQMDAHLRECVVFCTMAGAERIYGAGEGLEEYPVFMTVLEMRGKAWVDRNKMANLFPVTESTISLWREYYNKAMSSVDNAATLEARDEQEILRVPGAYFVHEEGKLLGIGWISDDKLLALAAVEKGAGERVMYTIMSLLEEQNMTIEVASTNDRAIRLYERLGFVKVREVSRWHDLSNFPR